MPSDSISDEALRKLVSELQGSADDEKRVWSDVDDETVACYLAGECTAEERERVERAMVEFPAVRESIELVRAVESDRAGGVTAEQIAAADAAWEQTSAELRTLRDADRAAWGEFDDLTLARYLADECTSAERVEVEQSAEQHPQLHAYIKSRRAAARQSQEAWAVATAVWQNQLRPWFTRRSLPNLAVASGLLFVVGLSAWIQSPSGLLVDRNRENLATIDRLQKQIRDRQHSIRTPEQPSDQEAIASSILIQETRTQAGPHTSESGAQETIVRKPTMGQASPKEKRGPFLTMAPGNRGSSGTDSTGGTSSSQHVAVAAVPIWTIRRPVTINCPATVYKWVEQTVRGADGREIPVQRMKVEVAHRQLRIDASHPSDQPPTPSLAELVQALKHEHVVVPWSAYLALKRITDRETGATTATLRVELLKHDPSGRSTAAFIIDGTLPMPKQAPDSRYSVRSLADKRSLVRWAAIYALLPDDSERRRHAPSLRGPTSKFEGQKPPQPGSTFNMPGDDERSGTWFVSQNALQDPKSGTQGDKNPYQPVPGNVVPAEAVPHLVRILNDKDESSLVRKTAIFALGECGPAAQGAIRELTRALGDSDPLVKRWSAFALSQIAEQLGRPIRRRIVADLIDILGDRLSDPQHLSRPAAAAAIGTLCQSGELIHLVRPMLIACLKDPDPAVRFFSAVSLLQFGGSATGAGPIG